MTKKIIFMGMLVMVLAFGMTVVGCDDGSTDDIKNDSALNGTWINNDKNQDDLKFNSRNYEKSFEEKPMEKGTYSTNSGKITFTTTHWHGYALSFYSSIEGVKIINSGIETKWYSKKDFETFGVYSTTDIDAIFQSFTLSYSVNGNTLTTSSEWWTMTYTRK